VNLLPPIPTGSSAPSGTAAPNLLPILIQAINTDSLALLNKLLVGDILTGTVLGRSNDGKTMVRTDRGVVALAGLIEAAEGSRVTLEVRATGARMQVVLLAVENGKPGSAPVAPPAPRAQPAAAPASAAEPTPEPTRQAANQLIATVLRASLPPVSPPVLPNATAPAATPPAAPPAASTPTAVSAPAPAAGTPLPAAPLPAGQRLALNILAVVPPENPDLPAPPPNGFAATVRGLTPAGQPMLVTPLGPLALDRALAWPVGTRVIATFEALAAPAGEAREAPQRGWTALLEAASMFDQPDRPELTAALERALPRIGPHLAAGLAAWLKPRQDPSDMVGPELKSALAKIGRTDLAQRLQNEFADLGRATPPSEPGWRTVIVPLVDENRLQQAMLSVRREPPQREAAERGEPGSVHFLLDVELSRLGPLQFDGLIRGKRLDLMLRTQRPLDPGMRVDITEIFQTAQQATGYAGQLFFQAGAPFLKTMPPQRDTGVVA